MKQMCLNDVVAEIVGDVVAGQAINKRQAAVERWDDIDADGRFLAGIDGVVARIDARARALRVKADQSAGQAQPELPFQLPAAVAMDLDGTTLIATRKLSRAEFARAIEIRRQQIAHDSAALREWRNALRQADRIWADHPDWSFGDCLNAISAATRQPAACPEVPA
ncbi:hypothetical protein [Amaricoccus macauensis]|uniref:hypothetical protein n=1 Tax=Amaricoccus macauensis TaxID=57001 RepID=UPI003C7EBD25